MPSAVVVGAQWGDEGKGKVIDLYTEFADLVVRFGGGANAGHTLVVEGQKVVTHLIPSGVLHPGKVCVLGDGMVIDPGTLLEEMAELKKRGLIGQGTKIWVSARAHVILPLHKEIDGLRERGRGAIGTTKRGIGPAYEAKMARRGVRMIDLLNPGRLQELLEHNLEETADYLKARGVTPPSVAEMMKVYLDYGAQLKPFIIDTSRLVHAALQEKKTVLFEGAQGALLDIDRGTYPFVTSSSTLAGGACTGIGIGPREIGQVIGICKAYSTRVGAGPFPTELEDEVGATLRSRGAEFGSTTGRPRRCGWLDVAGLRLAARWNGLGALAITKLDVLSGLPTIKLCVGYRSPGSDAVLDELPADLAVLDDIEPIYEEFEGWSASLENASSVKDLPVAAQRYLGRIEQLVDVPIGLVSVGPGRAATLWVDKPFAPLACHTFHTRD